MKVVLFDLDGVLVDSERVNMLAGKKSFEEIGIHLSIDEQKKIIGCNPADYDKIFSYRFDKKEMVKRHTKHYLDNYEMVKLFPFAKNFVKKVQKKFKVGLVTSCNKYLIENYALKLLDLKFDKYVTFEDCKKHKPFPDCYLLAARKFKVKPSECIVFEDSCPGVNAAKRAGMTCIAISNSFPASKLKQADLVVRNLNDKRIWSLLC